MQLLSSSRADGFLKGGKIKFNPCGRCYSKIISAAVHRGDMKYDLLAGFGYIIYMPSVSAKQNKHIAAVSKVARN